MDKKVKDFLNMVKEDKVKNLLGIELDSKYWEKIVGNDKEEDVRKQLEDAQNKRVVNKAGKVISDNRDMDRITQLNTRVEILKKANDELVRLRGMEISIRDYLIHIMNPNDETKKKLNQISKMYSTKRTK